MTDATSKDLFRAPTAEQYAQLHSIAHVGLQRLADVLLQPVTLLAAVVWLLNGTLMDVAVITTAATASFAIGAVVMPYALARVEDIRLVLLGTHTIRALASAIIAILGWRAETFTPRMFVAVLIVAMLFYQVSSAANVSRNPRSLIANIDQPTSAAARQWVGAFASLLAGVVAWRTLANPDLTFPASAGWLLLLGGVASLASVWFQVTAPVRERDMHPRIPYASMDQIRTIMSNPSMRRYLALRILFGASTLVDPFLIIFAMHYMRLNLTYLGLSMLAIALGQITSGVLWSLLRSWLGTKLSIQLTALFRLTGIALAIIVPFIGNSAWYASQIGNQRWASLAFVAVFFLLSLAQSTYARNEQAYAMRQVGLFELYPATNLVLNATLILTSIAPIFGAILIRATSFRAVMIIAEVITLIALLSTAFLTGRRRRPRRRYLSPELRGKRKRLKRGPYRRPKRRRR